MKLIGPIILLMLFLFGCENAIKDEAVSKKENPENVEIAEPIHSSVNNNTTVNEIDDLIGYWVGWFLPDEEETDYDKNVYAGEGFYWSRQNKITISIDTIRNDSVIGHSIVAGNFRPFHGTYIQNGTTFSVYAKEPGDDKYDGTFSFAIEKNMDTIHGKWTAYHQIQTPKRKYNLTKKNFEYQPKAELRNDFVDWIKTKTNKEDWGDEELVHAESYFSTTEKVTTLNPSVNILREDQVAKLTKADIYVLRNSIYAKHGYSFKKRQLRVYFDSHDWYMPVHTNIKAELSDIEKQNIKLLLRYEKYAEEYYDEFGRG